jgi:hypothetical protein
MTCTISRRKLFVNATGAAIAVTVGGPALAEKPRTEKTKPNIDLAALIKAHKAAYAAFLDTVHRSGERRDHAKANRAEERALLAVCSYPAIVLGDRRLKARYLLAIEARGELDLRQHMQAVLRSMLMRHIP